MRPPLGCILLVFACATAQHHAHRPSAHSSVDALLQHADELQLRDDQRATLERIDEREREQIAALRPAAQTREPSMRRRDPMFVGGGRSELHARRARGFQVDELDNAAFLEAEATLDEAQRPPARKVATDYRAELYDWQQSQN